VSHSAGFLPLSDIDTKAQQSPRWNVTDVGEVLERGRTLIVVALPLPAASLALACHLRAVLVKVAAGRSA
jgi:hypothetical protein